MDAKGEGVVRSGRYLNGVLTLIAGLLALHLLHDAAGLPGLPEAAAQRSGPEAVTIPNAAEQRERMIRAIGAMDARLQRIEERVLRGRLEVKVVEMPAIEVSQPSAGRQADQ